MTEDDTNEEKLILAKLKKKAKPHSRLFLVGFYIAVAIAAIVFTRIAMDSSRVRVGSPQELSAFFDEIGYPASLIRTENSLIPRIVAASIPKNWHGGMEVDQKKSLFFRTLLPMVMIANEEILADRVRLLELKRTLSDNGVLSSKDTTWIEKKSGEYELNSSLQAPAAENVNLLLQLIDIILRTPA